MPFRSSVTRKPQVRIERTRGTYLVVGVEQRLGNDDILLSGGGEDNDLSDILRSEGVAATGGRCQCPYNKVMI